MLTAEKARKIAERKAAIAAKPKKEYKFPYGQGKMAKRLLKLISGHVRQAILSDEYKVRVELVGAKAWGEIQEQAVETPEAPMTQEDIEEEADEKCRKVKEHLDGKLEKAAGERLVADLEALGYKTRAKYVHEFLKAVTVKW